MTGEPDSLRAVLDDFCQQTGRMAVSPLCYAQCQSWLDSGIPLSVIQRGIKEKLHRAKGKRYLATMPISWCEADVQETYQNWRRAVGNWA